ncbi:PREDICTED: odorant receptor 13a-like [Cyphomyrmex costatus]|uniref:odorant receptor 13a-like n=1 Tax=Cyphomyrmex costatus TaxID=456900 RepID=UPI0008522EA8|nr:PREDICTED: odorant receptor 13a-like [Cyphomyrmex costatus]
MDADRDLNFAIGWNRFNLSLVGIWPDPLQSPKQKSGLSRCRFMIASFFMLGFMCIPQSANLLFIWGNVDMMTENLATANIPVANSFMKAFTIWRKRKVLKPLVNFFYQDWYMPKTSEERTIMLKNAKIVRKISIWCTILTQVMVTIYIVLRISTIIRFSPSDPARPMLYTAYFPFDITRSPIFELICVCQILSAYSATVSYTGSDSFISMLVLHVCGQFENLRERLKNLANDPNAVKTSQEFKSKLRQIVMRHEHLNWFAKTIEDSFNMIMLIQMLSCTVQLCFQGFQVFRVSDTKNRFVLAHLYVYCYVGEMLLVQSTEIGFSAYESNWFNVPGKEARNLLFILHRSTAPLCLTAGKFSTFSLQMFSKIVRTSLGYLSVLLTVTERKE